MRTLTNFTPFHPQKKQQNKNKNERHLIENYNISLGHRFTSLMNHN